MKSSLPLLMIALMIAGCESTILIPDTDKNPRQQQRLTGFSDINEYEGKEVTVRGAAYPRLEACKFEEGKASMLFNDEQGYFVYVFNPQRLFKTGDQYTASGTVVEGTIDFNDKPCFVVVE